MLELFSFCFKRRKIVVQYIESSDLEEIEISELLQKMKGKLKNVQFEIKGRVKVGFFKVIEDVVFVCVLILFVFIIKKKMLKKGQ